VKANSGAEGYGHQIFPKVHLLVTGTRAHGLFVANGYGWYDSVVFLSACKAWAAGRRNGLRVCLDESMKSMKSKTAFAWRGGKNSHRFEQEHA